MKGHPRCGLSVVRQRKEAGEQVGVLEAQFAWVEGAVT